MTRLYKEVEVEFDLSDLDTEDLVAELEEREPGSSFSRSSLLVDIYHKRMMSQNCDREIDELIWQALGRIV